MGAADQTKAPVSSKAVSAHKLLFQLQVEQHHHDEMYHREIARLPMHQRLNHMALHFAKYAGKIAAIADIDAMLAVCIDTLIIALSTSNILNLDLWEVIEPEKREFLNLLTFGRSVAAQLPREMEDRSAFLRELAIATGRMAAACEKIDHLEEISFRAEIKQSISRLAALSLAFVSYRGIDPARAVRERLSEVKARLKLHGRI